MDSAPLNSISKTEKKSRHWKSNAGKTTVSCDFAYVMVSTFMKNNEQAATTKLWIDVTQAGWAQNFEELIPTRPAIATKVGEKTAATYLTLGAASTFVALSLI